MFFFVSVGSLPRQWIGPQLERTTLGKVPLREQRQWRG